MPAGDIGVGGREVGYMFGQYKALTHQFVGILTGKGQEFGGSLIRPEATGYGNVYFLENMLKTRGIDIKGKTVLVSGAGNVAQYTIEKLIQLGAKPLTCSDSDGFIYDPDGIDADKPGLHHGTEEHRPRTHQGICGGIPQRSILPRTEAMGHQGRHRNALRHTKRDKRRGRSEGSSTMVSLPSARVPTCHRHQRP